MKGNFVLHGFMDVLQDTRSAIISPKELVKPNVDHR